MYKHKETKQALNDWKKIKSMSKVVKAKFKYLIVDILDEPRNLDTIGNPKELKYRKTETWLRELTKKDRIVYEIRPGVEYDMPEEKEIVVFLQYLEHYDDK